MQKQIIKFGEESLAYYDKSVSVRTTGDLLDLMANSGSGTFAIHQESLSPEFFDLKSWLAGEMLQKISNYRKRLIIIGDYSNIASKSLRDFIYESNKTGKVIFCDDLEKAVKLLR
jgi:Domain of unknown function (DUF4180)